MIGQINVTNKIMSKSKFLRVRKSQNFNHLQPTKIVKSLNKDQYLYIDFADENSIKLLEEMSPQDSDEETEMIGKDHIAGINQLSSNTYKMFQYLTENRNLNDQRKNIDEVVRNRIRKLQNRKKRKEDKNSGRKNLKNYDISGVDEHSSADLGLDPEKLEEYLEDFNARKLRERLELGERQLQKSISSAGYYKKNQSSSLDLKMNNLPIRLPSIHKIRYGKQRL